MRLRKFFIFITVFGTLAATTNASAAVSSWQQKGASMVPKNTTDFSSANFRQSLQNLASTHANSVSLILPYYQSTLNSSDIQAGYNTQTDASLASAIDYAHSLGLQVVLKPHLECWCGTWRANINASDRASWFANYSSMLNHLGGIAQAHGAEEIVIGTELISMASGDINSDNTTQWRNMIASLRKVYSGKLTYSANWGESGFALETTQIKFWDALDQVGISAYYPLRSGTNTTADIASQWDNWNNNYIKPLNTSTNKPVVFTEVGYRSLSGTRFAPFDYWDGGSYDGTEQANLYSALFSYWNNYSYMQGVQLWSWDTDPNAGWPGNTDYTPQHKPAQDVMAQWFAGTSTPPPPPPPPSVGTFTSSATVSPAAPSVNNQVTETATVKNNAANAVNNILVDVETYDSSGNKVNQQYFDNQSFSASGTNTYTVNWTPTINGSYTIKIGVFSSGWGTVYDWNGTAGSFTVGSSQPPPPPPTNLSCNTINTGSFYGCYYNDLSLTNLALTRTDSSINFDWGSGSPDPSINADQFSAQWQGNFNFNAATYNFTAVADDGMRVWVDNSLVLDKWIDQPATTYNFSLPLSAGSHLIKVQYYENTGNAVAKLSWAQAATPPPPPPPTSAGPLDIWWPTNGTAIQGVQPFKAMVENLDISQYNMYWQVDGGTLNLMADSSIDYPHKEALVDVSGWNWNGNGPYTITFIAKDKSGNLIVQNAITITVTR